MKRYEFYSHITDFKDWGDYIAPGKVREFERKIRELEGEVTSEGLNGVVRDVNKLLASNLSVGYDARLNFPGGKIELWALRRTSTPSDIHLRNIAFFRES